MFRSTLLLMTAASVAFAAPSKTLASPSASEYWLVGGNHNTTFAFVDASTIKVDSGNVRSAWITLVYEADQITSQEKYVLGLAYYNCGSNQSAVGKVIFYKGDGSVARSTSDTALSWRAIPPNSIYASARDFVCADRAEWASESLPTASRVDPVREADALYSSIVDR
jgi:hypothetical protein